MELDECVILNGSNLGERHRYLNNLVKRTSDEDSINFDKLPEKTLIDKIFKIDVACCQRNVDYIVRCLKDNDILCVTRALKCFWLLDIEHRHIINPRYLETVLYPEMIKPAVNKMKRWIETNLKGYERCEEFYNYYKSNFEAAIKFLKFCSSEFILQEISYLIDRITPKHLKSLCSVCPHVAKVYFEGLQNNREALTKYVSEPSHYLNSIRFILRVDGNAYLDIIESYFDQYRHNRLSPSATRYIMKNYKRRFLNKRELYISKFLNINALSHCLSSDECKDILYALAKAEYIANWFDYRTVEPLFKRVPAPERSSLKKSIFVDKDVGDLVKEWPYKIPTPLELPSLDEHIFSEQETEFYDDDVDCGFRGVIRHRKYMKYQSCAMQSCMIPQKTLLDQLFNRYRFAGFAKTFSELGIRLRAASSIEERQSILLVLVSKSGKVPEHVETLMKLLATRHTNEPSNLRAAVVRSFVKRGCIWRSDDEVWTLMLTFAHGLGLDGQEGDPFCEEGLHAVMLRNILKDTIPPEQIVSKFKKHFTTFKEYNLNTQEINSIKKSLPVLLLPDCPNEFLDVVQQYNIKVKTVDGAEDMLVRAATGNSELINLLFKRKIARRQLVAQTFPLNQFEASYINALKHDVSLLADGESFANLASKEKTNHERFLRSLRIYFGEVNGLSAKHHAALESAFDMKAKQSLVRPLVMLSSDHFVVKRIQELSIKIPNLDSKVVAAFKVNSHKCTPPVDIDVVGWELVGAKAVANRVLIGRSLSLEQSIKSCLQWRRTYGVGMRLAINTSYEIDAFTVVCAKRPKLAIKVAVFHYFSGASDMNPKLWELLKAAFLKIDFQKLPSKLHMKLMNSNVPKNIEADFWVTMYKVKTKIKRKEATSALRKLEHVISKADRVFIGEITKNFIKDDLTVENFMNYKKIRVCGMGTISKSNIDIEVIKLYLRITAKYLLLCKTQEEQSEKVIHILNPLFDRFVDLWNNLSDNSNLMKCIDHFLNSLKYTEVFIDTQYTSCLPMFEQVIVRLQNILPRKEYFNKYVKLHFIILYFKSIRNAVEKDPNTFIEKDKENAMKIVGLQCGEYIADEITELKVNFFVSIIDIYKESLIDFLSDQFLHNRGGYKFMSWMVRGLLKHNTAEAQLLAADLSKTSNTFEEFADTLKASEFEEVKFFVNANFYDT